MSLHGTLPKEVLIVHRSESTPERFLFLEAKDTVPLKSEYKPPVKVLSRKPKSNGTAPRDGQSGTAGSSAAFDDDDSEAEATRRNELSLAERQQKAQREREEKQRKYIEVRERLFGTSTPDNGSQSVTPKAAPNSGARPTREKGKPKGSRDSRPASSSEPSPARGKGQSRQLFDPSYSPKPATSNVQKSADGSLQTTSETSNPDQPIRMPRGPDGSGRGGFGFSQRGNKASTGFGD